MKTTRWLTFLTTAAAFTVASCAPVDTAASPDVDTPPALRPLTTPTRSDGLKERIEAAIAQVRQRDLLTTNGFWTVFHGILGLGPSVTLLNPDTGKRVNALDYLADGNEVRGMRFLPTADGVDVEVRPGTFISQGHQDQFVAEMVQWGVPPERKFLVGGKEHTFADFLRHSKARASVRRPQELEWAILIIGQHFGTDITWTNAAGEALRFEELLRRELDQPLTEASCGGTHRLFGLTWVYHLHLSRGGRTAGIWKEVADRTAVYKKLAREFQNPDGSFSTDFFRGRGHVPDRQRRLNTTGHIFEWLALALSAEELREPWVENAANALAVMILDIQGSPMEGGTLYHAVHGLLLYSSRLYDTERPGALSLAVPLLPAGKDRP